MKRTFGIVLAVALLATGLSVSPAANAAPKVNPPKCTKSKAVPHDPKKVVQPTKSLKSLPRTIIFSTNCGDIVVETVGKKAPVTITALTTLARAGYFDQSLCHRLTTQGLFVLQCGDPTASASGSPTGWKGYMDENLPVGKVMTYPAGTVAMANSGPNTNGSQIFFVFGDSSLQPNYTIWGKVTSGLDILNSIASLGAVQPDGKGQYVYAGDGFPVQLVAIEKVIIK
jgi:peptidyl-prolyl cis-trans isomerase B (cyclophilin B)